MPSLFLSAVMVCSTGMAAQQSESNEEFHKRLNRALSEHREEVKRARERTQRPPTLQVIDAEGRNRPIGLWSDVKPRQDLASGSSSPNLVSSKPPDPQPDAAADAALMRGDYDEAIRILELERSRTRDDAALRIRIADIRLAKTIKEVRELNRQRQVELGRVLKKAELSLPAQLRMPAPSVDLAAVAPAPLIDSTVVDLRGVQFLVIDPTFFRPTGAGGSTGARSHRRFIEPPEPGKPLTAFAFADSPYSAAFENPEFQKLKHWSPAQGGARAPGELNRARKAFLERVAATPAKSIHVVTTATDEAFQKSRLKVKAAYEQYLKRRSELLGTAANHSVRDMASMLKGMEQEGWIKPGENLQKKEKVDPVFAAALEDRTRAIRWYGEIRLDQAEELAYRELAANVTRIMKEDDKR